MQPLAPQSAIHNGKYQIIEVIESNDVVITYLAFSTTLRKKVILKEFAPTRLATRDDLSKNIVPNSPEAAQDMLQLSKVFLEDAINTSKISHPSIPPVVDVFKENGTAYYALDHIEGDSLESIANESILPTFQAIKYISGVAEILRHIHSLGLLHLNVTPSNIIIRASDNQPVLTNLGALRIHPQAFFPLRDEEINAPFDESKIPPYDSIEHNLEPNKRSPQSDLYSLTATLYKVLTQQTPPTAQSLAHGGELILPPYLSPALQSFITKGMSVNNEQRFQSADEFIDQLREAFNGGNTSAGPSPYEPIQPADEQVDSFTIDLDMDDDDQQPVSEPEANEPPAETFFETPPAPPAEPQVFYEPLPEEQSLHHVESTSDKPSLDDYDYNNNHNNNSNHRSRPRSRTNYRAIAIFAGIFILIILGIGAIFFFQMSDSSADTDDDDLLTLTDTHSETSPDKTETTPAKTETAPAKTSNAPIQVKDMPFETDGIKALYTGPATPDSIPDGKDCFIQFKDEKLKSYKGEMIKGEVTGQGEVQYHNGNLFKGTLRKGSMVEGTLRYAASGNYYTGTFENDSMYNGTWYNKNGRPYAKVINGKEQQL